MFIVIIIPQTTFMGNDDKPSNWIEQIGERVPVNDDVDKQHGRTLGKLDSASTSQPTEPSVGEDSKKKTLKGDAKESKLIKDGKHNTISPEYDRDLHASKVNESRDLAQAKSNTPKIETKVSANVAKSTIALKAIQKVGLRLIPVVGTAIAAKEIYDFYQEYGDNIEDRIDEFKDELLEKFGEFLEPDTMAKDMASQVPRVNQEQDFTNQEVEDIAIDLTDNPEVQQLFHALDHHVQDVAEELNISVDSHEQTEKGWAIFRGEDNNSSQEDYPKEFDEHDIDGKYIRDLLENNAIAQPAEIDPDREPQDMDISEPSFDGDADGSDGGDGADGGE